MLFPWPSQQGLSKFFIIIILGCIVLIFVIVLFILVSPKESPPQKITLTMWGVWDETTDWQGIIDAYERSHPYVTINYAKKRYEEYERLLVEGWAQQPNAGPDIYALPNSWINKFKHKGYITPMPANTTVTYFRTEKILFKTETKFKNITEPGLTPNDISRDYIDVVYDDVVFDESVYALPFGVDTLVLYYNKDLLDQAHLAQPPSTWADFATTVANIAVVDGQDNVLRAATALGAYKNVPRAHDIVSLLMMQNGATMVSGDTVAFDKASAADSEYYPGVEALRFFTDFSWPVKSVYTWNSNMPNALDFFADGNLTFFFGYKYQESEIQAKSQGLRYAIAPVPQVNPENEINFANYWTYTVAKQTSANKIDEAWDFLQFASEPDRIKPYLEASNQTSVLRSVLNEQLGNPDQSTFARQALTAQSWYHGLKPETAEEYFAEMITDATAHTVDTSDLVKTTARKIQLEYSTQ